MGSERAFQRAPAREVGSVEIRSGKVCTKAIREVIQIQGATVVSAAPDSACVSTCYADVRSAGSPAGTRPSRNNELAAREIISRLAPWIHKEGRAALFVDEILGAAANARDGSA
jgi:hypothetical protein